MRIIAPFAILAGLLAAAGPAAAEDFSGTWTFRTQPTTGVCVIEGEMRLAPAKPPLAYSCTFTARTACAFSTPQFQVVEESCGVARQGGDLLITSKVGKVTDAGPPLLRTRLMSPGQYFPDDFTLHPDARTGDLIGSVHDPVRQGPVRFWRKKEITS